MRIDEYNSTPVTQKVTETKFLDFEWTNNIYVRRWLPRLRTCELGKIGSLVMLLW